MSFNIIKNTLETQENGVLIIENDVYRIKMRYIGNYREDLKNHKLNTISNSQFQKSSKAQFCIYAYIHTYAWRGNV